MADENKDVFADFKRDHQGVIDDLKSQYPKIEFVVLENIDQAFAIAPSSRPVLEKFMMDSSEPKKKLNAVEHFVAGCVKYPESARLWEMLREMPGLTISLSDPCSRISGMSRESEIKKF